MVWRLGLIHPVGGAFLVLTALLAGLSIGLPGLDLGRKEVTAVLAAGLVAYLLSATVIAVWPPAGPDFRLLRRIRQQAHRLLRERAASSPPGVRPELTLLANAASSMIQDEISPSFRHLLRRATELNAHIAAFERVQPAPDAALMDELRADYGHYREARERCIQQAVNGELRLVGVLREPNSTSLVNRVGEWIETDLAGLQRVLDGALLGRRPQPEPIIPPPPPGPEPEMQAVPPLGDELVKAVEKALRRLHKLGELGQSPLAAQLPHSLAAQGRLSRGQAVYDLLVEGIQRLKPAEDQPGQAADYEILWREYVRGESTVSIRLKLSVEESTFYRWRKDAVAALAQDLWEREHRTPPHKHDPVAMDYLG